jgi:septum formation protein
MPVSITETTPLLLASTSRYRAELLARLHIPFTTESPGVDEAALDGETPVELARRLAYAKAAAVARRHSGRWVIGSDQVAAWGERVLGKPGSRTAAVEQLRLQSGNAVQFHTAVTLITGDGTVHDALDTTIARFRRLSDTEIERYVDAEPAYDCAGSFKCEGLGITLCDAIETSDPTALVGLPLIAVRRLLNAAGYPRP